MENRNQKRKPVYEFEYSKHPDPKEVATALLMGVDILLVDPNLYPSIIPPLEYYRKRYEQTNQDKVVEKIDWLIDYINKYPERQMIAAKLSQRPRSPRVKPPPFSRDECEEQINLILNKKTNMQYTKEEYQQLITEMKKKRKELIDDQEFQEADVYGDRIRTLINMSESSEAYKFSRSRCKDLEEKVQEAEDSLNDMRVRWERVLENFNQEREENLQSLRDEQQKEYEELQEKLETTYPKTLPKYTASHLELRRKEETLVLAKQYEEAQAIKNELETFEGGAELNQLEEQWRQSNQLQLNTLAKKHQSNYDIRVDNFQREEQAIRKAMKNELAAQEHKLETLKIMLRKAEMSADPTIPTRSSLPSIKTIRQVEPHELAFRQRALMNIKIYSLRPPQTARSSPRKKKIYN